MGHAGFLTWLLQTSETPFPGLEAYVATGLGPVVGRDLVSGLYTSGSQQLTQSLEAEVLSKVSGSRYSIYL